jgi:hypothetical protein
LHHQIAPDRQDQQAGQSYRAFDQMVAGILSKVAAQTGGLSRASKMSVDHGRRPPHQYGERNASASRTMPIGRQINEGSIGTLAFHR